MTPTDPALMSAIPALSMSGANSLRDAEVGGTLRPIDEPRVAVGVAQLLPEP